MRGEALYDLRYFFSENLSVVAGFAALAEGDDAGSHRVERMVTADADILTSFYFRSALADDDHAGRRLFAVGELHSEVFRSRVAKILC